MIMFLQNTCQGLSCKAKACHGPPVGLPTPSPDELLGPRLHSRKGDLSWLGSRALAPQPSRGRVGFSPKAVRRPPSKVCGRRSEPVRVAVHVDPAAHVDDVDAIFVQPVPTGSRQSQTPESCVLLSGGFGTWRRAGTSASGWRPKWRNVNLLYKTPASESHDPYCTAPSGRHHGQEATTQCDIESRGREPQPTKANKTLQWLRATQRTCNFLGILAWMDEQSSSELCTHIPTQFCSSTEHSFEESMLPASGSLKEKVVAWACTHNGNEGNKKGV